MNGSASKLILELYADERALRGPDCRGDQDDGSGDASAVQWPARPGIGPRTTRQSRRQAAGTTGQSADHN